jgi:hypothetical protein
MSIYVWDSSGVRRQLLGNGVRVRQNNQWVTATSVKVRQNNQWVDVWYNSDPQTLTFNATKVQSLWSNSWTLAQGDSDYENKAAIAGYHLSNTSKKDVVGVIGSFKDSSNNTLESVLGSNPRTVIKSATLYMQRSSTDIGYNDAYGTVYTAMYKGAVGSASPNYNKLDYTTDYIKSKAFTQSSPLSKGEKWNMQVADKTVEGLRDSGYSIALLSRITNVGTDRTTFDYMWSTIIGPLTGSTTGYKPTLVVTIDYV